MGGKTAKTKSVKTQTQADRRTAVLVVGMHRSGTSALTRTLGLLGCTLPTTLLPANDANRLGYWESPAVTKLSDEILATAGMKWNDWAVLTQQRYLSKSAAKHRKRAQSILDAEFGRSRLFVVKDPRFCRLLGFWIEAVREFGATPAVVVPIRHPLDVATSMEARDGTNPSIAVLLWLRYTLDAEIASRHTNRSYVRFYDLLENWRSVADQVSSDLEIDWPQQSAAASKEIDDFLSPELCHHSSDETRLVRNPDFTPWVKTSFDIFRRWTHGQIRKSDYRDLDQIRTAFDEATPAFSPAIMAGQRAEHRRRQVRAELENAQVRVDELKSSVGSSVAELGAAREQINALRETVATRDSEVAQLRTSAEDLETTLSARSDELSAVVASNDDLSSQLADLDGDLVAARARIDELEYAVSARDAELARIQATVTELERTVETCDREVAHLRANGEELEATLKARQNELSAVRTRNDDLDQQLFELRVDLTEASRRNDDLEANIEGRNEELVREQTTVTELERIVDARDREMSSVEGQLDELKSDLAIRSDELSQATERIDELDSTISARTADLSNASKRIAELEDAVSVHGEELSARTAEITELSAELREHRARKRLLEASVGTLAREIRAMRTSASWRITAPLYAIADRIKWLPRRIEPSASPLPPDSRNPISTTQSDLGLESVEEPHDANQVGDQTQAIAEAMAASRERNWTEAITRWKGVLSDHADQSAEAYVALSRAYRGCGDIVAAEEAVELGRAIDPDYLPLTKEFAEVAMARKDWPEAVRWWNAVLNEVAEPSPGIYVALCRAYRGCGDHSSAENAVEMGRRIAPDWLPLATEHAQIASAIGDWPEAVRRWNVVLSDSEGRLPGVYAALCRAHRGCGDLVAAEKVVQLGRANSSCYRPLATEYAEIAMARKDWSEAVRRSNAVLRDFADPSPGMYAALSRAYRGKGDLASAEEAVELGLSLDADYLPLATEKAEIAMAREKWSEAIDRWQTIIRSLGHQCSKNILDRVAALCFGLFEGDEIDRALALVRELKSHCGEKRMILALEGIGHLRATRIDDARDHWAAYWQRALNEEAFACEPNLSVPAPSLDGTNFLEAARCNGEFRYGDIESRFCVYTALIGDYDELCPPLFRPPGLDFICFSDRPRSTPGWDVRIVEPSTTHPALECRKIKILPYEYLDDYDHSLYVDASVLFLGDPIILFHHWLNNRAFIGWRHAVRSDLFEECEAILARLKHEPEPIVNQYGMYLQEGVPRHTGLIEAGFLWRDHRDERTRQLMSCWWEHLSEYSSGRDQPGLAYCMWKNDVRPEVMPDYLGTVHNNDFMVVRPHSTTTIDLERSRLNCSSSRKDHSGVDALPANPGARSLGVTPKTKRLAWVYSTQFQAVASTLMRGYQLTEIARRHLGDRIEACFIDESAVESQKETTLFLTKGFLKGASLQELEAAKEAGNTIWVDYVDDPPRPELHDAIDGYVASSISQYLQYSDQYPDRLVQLVTHHTDPRIDGIRGPADYCNIGYFGELVNARYRAELQGHIDFCLVYTKVADSGWIDRLRHCNVHYAVRDQQEPNGIKPFLKGFTAARCESNIIVPLDESDAMYYLGSDYPYILMNSELESVQKMIEFVKESFGGPEWNRGLELMTSVRRRCSPEQISRELSELMEKDA